MKKRLPLTPPSYDSLEENYKANLVYTLAWAWIIGVTTVIAAMTLLLPVFWWRATITVVSVDATALVCLWLNSRSYLKAASIFFSLTLWLIASYLALTAGGINAPAIVAYLPVIITSGFLLGGMSGIFMSVLCVLSSIVFVILEMHGILPPVQIKHTPLSILMAYSVSGLLIAFMQYLITAHIGTSIQTIIKETDERRIVETKLRESEFYNRMVAESKILGVAWATAEGKLLDASATFCSMFGYDISELRGLHFSAITHPDDTTREIELVERIFNHEMDAYTIEKRYRHKDGTYFWVELHLSCYRNAKTGAIDFFTGIVQNIQQKKQAEESQREIEARYRALVENATEALVVYDVEKGRYESVSESAAQLFRISKADFLQIGPIDISPEYQPDGTLSSEAAKSFIKEAMHGGKPVFEWTHRDAAGNLIPCEVCLVRLPSTSGVLIRGSIIDITKRKAVEAATKDLNESLEKKVKERTAELEILNHDLFRFNTMLSHDLRSAIRRIKSLSDILLRKAKKGSLDESTTGDLELIAQDATKMDNLVTGLLEISKLGSKPLQLRPVDLNETMEVVMADVKKQWQHKEHQIEITTLPVLNSDPILIQQIFTNLVSNAFKYSSLNEVIRLHVKGTDNGDHYLFSITDNGVGFDMANHDKLFKAFIRLHHETEFEGTGLGLNSVKRFVEKLGGRIWAQSAPGSGSTFYFTVPFTEVV